MQGQAGYRRAQLRLKRAFIDRVVEHSGGVGGEVVRHLLSEWLAADGGKVLDLQQRSHLN